MIVHVSNEIFEFNLGGIGTVLTILYQQKKPEDLFVFIGETSLRPASLPNDIIYIDEKSYESGGSFPWAIGNTVFFHSYDVFKNLDCKKKVFVSHSNFSIERLYTEFIDKKLIDRQIEVFKSCDEIVSVSNFENELVKETIRRAGLPVKPVSVVLNGIQTKPVSVLNKAGTETYGYIGRLDSRKGIYNLVLDFPKTGRLVIATGGKGKYIPANLIKLNHLLLAREVRNIMPAGYCMGDRRNSFFSNIDASIIPSLYEPFGMTVLESLAAGVPVISVNFGGPREILGDDYPLYFDVNNPHSLGLVIQKFRTLSVADKSNLLKKINTVLEKFTAVKMAQGYREIEKK